MESRPPTPCSICGRWSSSAGAGMCGVCRAARAIASIPFDSRVSVESHHYILSILDRTVGEIYGWIATQHLFHLYSFHRELLLHLWVSPDNSGRLQLGPCSCGSRARENDRKEQEPRAQGTQRGEQKKPECCQKQNRVS